MCYFGNIWGHFNTENAPKSDILCSFYPYKYCQNVLFWEHLGSLLSLKRGSMGLKGTQNVLFWEHFRSLLSLKRTQNVLFWEHFRSLLSLF